MITVECFGDTTETSAIFEKKVERNNCSPFTAISAGLACCDQKSAH